MKGFFAALVAVAAAAFIAAVVFTIAPRFAGSVAGGRETAAPQAQTEREATREREERRRGQQQQLEELEEQRRERLTLLAATLGVEPVARVTRKEAQLFQRASRNREHQIAVSEPRALRHLCAPVQIDEWTTLRAGTPVEVVRYARDNVITIRHDGAVYDVAPWQVALPIAQRLPSEWCPDGTHPGSALAAAGD